jgi:hypothetical protein
MSAMPLYASPMPASCGTVAYSSIKCVYQPQNVGSPWKHGSGSARQSSGVRLPRHGALMNARK